MATRLESLGEKRPMETSGASAALALMDIAAGFVLSQALYILAEFRVADALIAGPRTSEDLAGMLGVDGALLSRVLKMLAVNGILSADDEQRFSLNALSMPLCESSPYSIRDVILLFGSTWHWNAWSGLTQSLRTGKTAFEVIHHHSIFDYLATHPDARRNFETVMHRHTRHAIPSILGAYDFGSARTIVDVGGGSGLLLGAILRANPRSRGILLDRAEVKAEARAVLVAAGVLDRCELRVGDFTEHVPPGGDLYLLKNVLHDWNDDRAVQLLRRCRNVMGPGTQLLILETLLGRGPDRITRRLDLQMLVLNGGREREEREIVGLCERAGLAVARTIPTGSLYTIVEAVRK